MKPESALIRVVNAIFFDSVGDKWLVTAGLAEDDTIVLEGFQKLAPGALVDVTISGNH